jgi:hypothetical protein
MSINAALIDAGDKWLMIDGESWNKVKQREYMLEQSNNLVIESIGDTPTAKKISHDAEQLAYFIKDTATKKGVPADHIERLNIDVRVIDNIIRNAFWNPQKKNIFTVTQKNVLNQYTENDAFGYLCAHNGKIYDNTFLYELENKSDDYKGIAKNVSSSVRKIILDYLKMQSQRTNIEMRVDMFAIKPRIEMKDELARVIYVHRPYEAGKEAANYSAIVSDYKAHFPMLDEFLDFLIASRFSADRKKSYLWFKCSSDWGKGFLISVLSDLEMTVELSIKEVEAIFEGKPVGKSMHDFKGAIAIVLDEFKSVKSELKQLQNEISLSPKFQLSFKVEVFSKLFFSAENVPSLVGENGVEAQFLNRFSYFELNGIIDDRKLFKTAGRRDYITAIKTYVAKHLNDRIKHMVSLGIGDAARTAELSIAEFRSKYGLSNSFSSVSDNLPSIARDIAQCIGRMGNEDDGFVLRSRNGFILQRPKKYVENYIYQNIPFSEKATLIKKADEIIQQLSVDGEQSKAHRDNRGKTVKGILIRAELVV